METSKFSPVSGGVLRLATGLASKGFKYLPDSEVHLPWSRLSDRNSFGTRLAAISYRREDGRKVVLAFHPIYEDSWKYQKADGTVLAIGKLETGSDLKKLLAVL
jgi:hypothetical protein